MDKLQQSAMLSIIGIGQRYTDGAMQLWAALGYKKPPGMKFEKRRQESDSVRKANLFGNFLFPVW
jgi:hypothetical protein